MKKMNIKLSLLIAFAISTLFGCTTMNRSMKEANTLVEFQKNDFTLTDQVYADAKQVKILGIDWWRIFKKEKGKTVSTPLIGNSIKPGKVESYALHNLLSANSGNDVVFYPSFEKTRFKILFLYSRTEITVKARLGKLNK